jgi:hypothetical protein
VLVTVSDDVSEAVIVFVEVADCPEERTPAPKDGVAVCVRPDVTVAVGVRPVDTVPDLDAPNENDAVFVPEDVIVSDCVGANDNAGTKVKSQSYLRILCCPWLVTMRWRVG